MQQLAAGRTLLAERPSARFAAPTRTGARLCRASAHKFPGFLGKIVSSGGKGKGKHRGHDHDHGHDDPSGMWQSQGHHWHDADSEAAPHLDGPAADYVALHPAPVEDDPFHPDLPANADAATAAAVWGPDMHGVLEVARPSAVGSGGAPGTRFVLAGAGGDAASQRHAALLAQLRERALEGSSDDDESWRRMDIPGLLLSPHHAAAIQSLSSASDSEDGLGGAAAAAGGPRARRRGGGWDGLLAPDFADLTLAREADAAAQAAAELVPPELRHLARAANILGVHSAARRGAAAGLGLGLALGLGGGAGSAASGEASGSEAGAELHMLEEANRFLGLPEEPLTPQQLEAAAALLLSSNNISPAGGLQSSWCVTGSVADTGFDADADTASDCEPGFAAAAAAVAAGDAALIGGNTVAQSARPARGSSGGADRAGSSSSSGSSTSSARAAAVAALSEEGIDWLGGPPAVAAATNGSSGAAAEEESRSVQLRRSPGPVGGVDAATRSRVAATVAGHVADAHAHVVRRGSTGTVPSSVDGERYQQQQRYSLTRGVVGAAGQEAADAAAAAVAAEARRAVWGEGGWPYDSAVRSTDVVEELKHEIQEQQEAAEHGSARLGLP
ncbi:hypothetical protein HYH02_010346 [Chlamydomonas schloesseri]|uniref:Uncharacterized protein n=1 Tax=Chlamydomonas schloesseri TaxID=2026947 RepID=A0A835TMK4_9CHLO|nr:hypothetical protein HYH02_010346 [Chlamydomonas schloesseri]|eukprot:KAG2440465.1 hypothetical protein HYH02_010346 [Chlamydomonas schloesseri]